MEERTIFGMGLLLAVAAAIALAVTGHGSWVAAPGVLAFAVLVGWGISFAAQRRAEHVDSHGDGDEPVPLTSAAPDADPEWGDTEEAHDDLSPHDLPVGHPGRHEAEAQADERFEREHGGVTEGNR